MKIFKIFVFIILTYFFLYAQATVTHRKPKNILHSKKTSLIHKKIYQEKKVKKNPFVIVFYKPNYILPYYYTLNPYQQAYEGNTPANQKIYNYEFKYQFSLKFSLIPHFFSKRLTLYLAYTQLSYWQLFAKSAYFRETNYEPEVFLEWSFSQNNYLASIGAVHESNGRGSSLERSWNRVYIDLSFSTAHWLISIKPWFLVVKHNSSKIYNPDITSYLGYGRLLLNYKLHKLGFSLTLQNILESGFSRGSEIFTISFPIYHNLKGYVQVFSGYGQSLIEYDHYTNGAGVGVALSNWI